MTNFISAAGGGSTNIGSTGFSVSGNATGFAIGTPVWFDAAVKVNASTGTLAGTSCNAHEYN